MAEGDVYAVKLEGLANSGNRWNIVFHFVIDVEIEPDELFKKSKAISKLVYDNFVQFVIPLLADDTFLLSARGNRVFPTQGVPATHAPIPSVPGDIVGGSVPADVAVVATQRTNMPGRNFLGRFFVCGLPEVSHAFDQILSITQAAWQTAMAALGQAGYTDAESNEYNQVVLSQKLANTEPPPPIVFAEVMDVETNVNLRNQRRRGRQARLPITS